MNLLQILKAKTAKLIETETVKLIKSIVEKKKAREIAKQNNSRQTPLQVVSRLIKTEGQYIGTPYFKTMIEGNSGIYLASPTFGHSDYNKCRLFDKTESNLKLMRLFNSYFSRQINA